MASKSEQEWLRNELMNRIFTPQESLDALSEKNVEKVVRKSRPSIALALSGGGFRATMFHLGVIRYLFEKRLLKGVKHVCSVSGGSVLAAHLVLRWRDYTGDAESFQEAAQEIIDFVRSDVRGRVFRRWLAGILSLLPRMLASSRWSRTSLL